MKELRKHKLWIRIVIIIYNILFVFNTHEFINAYMILIRSRGLTVLCENIKLIKTWNSAVSKYTIKKIKL